MKRAGVLLSGGMLALVVFSSQAAAQTPAAPSSTPVVAASEALIGTWSGSVANYPLILHVAPTPQGVAVTFDSPAQGARGLQMTATLQSPTHLIATFAPGAARFDGELNAEGKLAGRWTQGSTVPAVFTRTDASPTAVGTAMPIARPQDPTSTPYRSEEVRYPNAAAGIELAGTLTLPQGPGPFPAVVLISGSGAQNRNEEALDHRPFLVLADHLTRQGIAVLRSDDRQVGGSGGRFATATSQDFAADTRAAVAYLRARPEVRKDAIGLAGHSEGGLIAPMVAAEDAGIAFVVLMAGPGLVGEEILYLQAAAGMKADGRPQAMIDWNRDVQRVMFETVKQIADTAAARAKLETSLPPAIDALGPELLAAIGLETPAARTSFIRSQIAFVNSPWSRYFLTYDPRPALRRVKAPVLAINGSLDLQVPSAANLAEIRKALTEAGNRDVTATELPGLNHLFQTARTGSASEYRQISETFAPAALETISKWILEKTRGR